LRDPRLTAILPSGFESQQRRRIVNVVKDSANRQSHADGARLDTGERARHPDAYVELNNRNYLWHRVGELRRSWLSGDREGVHRTHRINSVPRQLG